jgi:hypothetical protein
VFLKGLKKEMGKNNYLGEKGFLKEANIDSCYKKYSH